MSFEEKKDKHDQLLTESDRPKKMKNSAPDDDTADTQLEVHSANSWETADLGDKQRNNKFLRLMGAGKKEHHGKFVIGDKSPAQARSKNPVDSSHLNEDLAEQYEQSMGHRLASGPRGHLGLGYHPDDGGDQTQKTNETSFDSTSGKDSDKRQDKKSVEDADSNKEDSGGDSAHRKRESIDGDSSGPIEKKMKFVKSSS